MSEELQNEEQAQQAPAKDDKAADLNINDLNAMRQIIDVASSRGAFKPGSEMIAVGQVYEKLSNFLDQVAKQAEAAKATQGA